MEQLEAYQINVWPTLTTSSMANTFWTLLAIVRTQGEDQPHHSCLLQIWSMILWSWATVLERRKAAWYLTPQRRLGCRLLILEALETYTTDSCPAEDDIINCFWVGNSGLICSRRGEADLSGADLSLVAWLPVATGAKCQSPLTFTAMESVRLVQTAWED